MMQGPMLCASFSVMRRRIMSRSRSLQTIRGIGSNGGRLPTCQLYLLKTWEAVTSEVSAVPRQKRRRNNVTAAKLSVGGSFGERHEHTKEPAAFRSRWTVLALSVIALTVAAVVGVWFWQARPGHVLTDKDKIVLGDFANSTGDPVFDGTLREGLSVQLEQSPFLSMVSDEGIHQTLQMMAQPTNAKLTPDVARELCQRTGSAAALNGSITLIGTRYELILKAIDCGSGNVLAGTEAQANDKNHVLDALGHVASEMRRKLGESLSSIQQYTTPLEQATTPSLQALQAYSLGYRSSWVDADQPAALHFFQRALQLDPSFAMAYRGASNAYTVMGENTSAAQNLRKAFALRARVSERERLLIEEDYYFSLTGDLLKARHIDELGTQTYPREPLFHLNLAVDSSVLGLEGARTRAHELLNRVAGRCVYRVPPVLIEEEQAARRMAIRARFVREGSTETALSVA